MIQIRQTKDDLTAKRLLILVAHTSGFHAAGVRGRVRPWFPVGQAKIIGECRGDFAFFENAWTNR
jgi:hypothetical protein